MQTHLVQNLLAQILKQKNPLALEPHLSLFDDLALNGDQFEMLLSEIESELDLIIEEEQIDEFDTISDLIDFFDRCQ